MRASPQHTQQEDVLYSLPLTFHECPISKQILQTIHSHQDTVGNCRMKFIRNMPANQTLHTRPKYEKRQAKLYDQNCFKRRSAPFSHSFCSHFCLVCGGCLRFQIIQKKLRVMWKRNWSRAGHAGSVEVDAGEGRALGWRSPAAPQIDVEGVRGDPALVFLVYRQRPSLRRLRWLGLDNLLSLLQQWPHPDPKKDSESHVAAEPIQNPTLAHGRLWIQP